MSKLFTKDVNETLDITIDWSNVLDLTGSPDDTISTSTWTVPAATASPDTDDLQISGENIVDPNTSAFFSAGVEGSTYVVKNEITTTLGATFERHIYISVTQLEPSILSTLLIVEDGTVVADANSYGSLAEADAFHAARNHTDWFEGTVQERIAWMIDAGDYMRAMYTDRWKGVKVDDIETQRMDWPRAGAIIEETLDPYSHATIGLGNDLTYVFPENVVPRDVKEAQFILALERKTAPLLASKSIAAEIKRLKAGSAEIEYFPHGGGTDVTRRFPEIDGAQGILKKYLEPRRNLFERA